MIGRPVIASARLQLALMRRAPAQVLVVVTTPLLTLMFLSIADQSHSRTLFVTGTIAPFLIGLWVVSLDLAANIVDGERRGSTLELLIASQASLAQVIAGRLLAITALGGLCAAEAWLVAAGFGVVLVPAHFTVLLAGLAAGVFATVGTASMLGVCLAFSRNSFILVNALSYPLYILGCIAVPSQFLPSWLRPVTHFVFFSWIEDLLRSAFGYGSVGAWKSEVAYVLLLGAASFAAAYAGGNIIARRLAAVGSVTLG